MRRQGASPHSSTWSLGSKETVSPSASNSTRSSRGASVTREDVGPRAMVMYWVGSVVGAYRPMEEEVRFWFRRTRRSWVAEQ